MDKVNQLPEFRVSLERVKEGEEACPKGEDIPHYEYQGQRTKLGGVLTGYRGMKRNGRAVPIVRTRCDS